MAMDSTQAQQRQQIQIPSFAFNSPNNKFRREVPPPRPAPIITMNASKQPVKMESITTAPQGVWTTPTSQGIRPRPATIHEGFSYCIGEGFEGVPAWDSSSLQMQQMQQQTPNDTMSSRPLSVHQEYYPATTMESNTWVQKPCDDSLELQALDSEMNIGQAYTTDEAIPILDLRYQGASMDGESMNFDGSALNQRRMSGSSFTMSTSGGLSDMPSYEDFSAALSDAPSFTSDYPPPSNRNSMMSSTQLSPVASPRMTPQSRSELVRTQSRGRASPSPRPGVRAAPYSVDGPRNKRWSTGSYGTAPNRRPSPFVYHHPHDAFNAHARMSSRHSSPTIAHAQMPLNFGNLQAAQHPYLLNNNPGFRNSMLLPSQLPSHGYHPDAHQFDAPPQMLPHGLFRMLQSNADPHSLHNHYTDLSDPPDLYASLQEEQLPPPPEDMNPSDPDLVPHEQELRFDGDWYTPKWVRGHGNKREGWCGICKPGRWLVLKNSAFWYDKSFTHGISAATGSPFQEPQETRRMDGNPDVWEGLCGSCNEWIALVSSKKKGTTWFRHAYKCHTHPKIKDAPKRRRESSHTRVMGTNTTSKPKTEPQTPQMSQPVSGVNTPTISHAPQPLTPQHSQQQQQQQEAEAQSQQQQQQAHQQHHQQQQQQPQHQLQPPPIPQRHELHVYDPHQHLHPQLQIQVTSAPQQQQTQLRTSTMSPLPMENFPNMI